jgi:fluoride ion exporter CrcB/FEX
MMLRFPFALFVAMFCNMAWAVPGVLQANPGLSPALRLALTTGLLGGLTTFSTFSAEAFHLAQRGA